VTEILDHERLQVVAPRDDLVAENSPFQALDGDGCGELTMVHPEFGPVHREWKDHAGSTDTDLEPAVDVVQIGTDRGRDGLHEPQPSDVPPLAVVDVLHVSGEEAQLRTLDAVALVAHLEPHAAGGNRRLQLGSPPERRVSPIGKIEGWKLVAAEHLQAIGQRQRRVEIDDETGHCLQEQRRHALRQFSE